jgi:hypothetical protein
MINKYYYLISSLPYLRFAQESPIANGALLLECRKWLSGKAMRILEGVSISDFTPNQDDAPIIKIWKEFDLNLRKELVFARNNVKHNRREKPAPFAKIILEQAHPLLMEQELERIRWSFLDSLEAGNFFDINFLVVYFLKVQILERLRMFNKEKGSRAFESICEAAYV